MNAKSNGVPGRMCDSTAERVSGIQLAPMTARAFCDRLLEWAGAPEASPRLVTYLNAHNVNLAFADPQYAAILSRADLVYADGMGGVWGWRRLGREVPERVNAGDFIVEFLRRAAERDLSVYLLGSRPGEAEAAAERWRAAVPGLRVAGARDGYFNIADEPAVAAAIRAAGPAILLVGMGVPRQEEWAARWLERLGAPVVWCVGALFEYAAGKRSRAPVWMRRAGLEWTWRLALEPRRMAGRYLAGNLLYLRNLRRLRRAGR